MVMVDEHATGELPILRPSTPLIGASTTCRPGDAADDEVITGPLPVIDLAGGHLHVTRSRDHVIIAIDGGLDHDLSLTVIPAIAQAAGAADAVIVDLDDVALLDQDALDAVLEAVDADGARDRCVIVSRLSARMVLERWGVAARYSVFGSVADALQARAFAASGYGTGWS